MLKRRENLQICTEYEKRVVSRQFDHGEHDGVYPSIHRKLKETQRQFLLVFLPQCDHRFLKM